MGLESQIIPPSPVLVPGEVRTGSFSDFSWFAKEIPPGSVFSTYGWAQQGSLIVLWFRISATKPGKKIRGVSFPLPKEIPHPSGIFTLDETGSTDIFIGDGAISKSSIFSPWGLFKKSRPAVVSLRRTLDSYSVHLLAARPLNASHVWGMIHYYG